MKFESSKHETKLSMKLTEQVQARILNKTHREPANKPETTNKLKMKKTNDERWRKETDDKETPKTGDRRRQSKTSMTQQHMYLHSYESLAAPSTGTGPKPCKRIWTDSTGNLRSMWLRCCRSQTWPKSCLWIVRYASGSTHRPKQTPPIASECMSYH